MARKTQRRRKLYGRRQRGGVPPRWKILLVALAYAPKSVAQTLGELVSAWWNNPNPLDPRPSYRLAQKLLGELPAETPVDIKKGVAEIAESNATVSNATDVTPPHTPENTTAVQPYLNGSAVSSVALPEGNYSVGLTSGELTPYTINGSLPGDISPGSTVFIVKTREEEDYDEDDNPITVTYYDIQKESDKGDPTYKDRIFSVRADEVTLTPKTTGARRRTRRRKTLRRKK